MSNAPVFEKVSFNRFKEDYKTYHLGHFFGEEPPATSEDGIKLIYDGIKLPKRSTSMSAGYDFYVPYEWVVTSDIVGKLCTGIRVKLEPNQYLAIHIRSSIGVNNDVMIANGTCIIDADYYDAENEGHIIIPFRNISRVKNKIFSFDSGDRVAQGIINTYAITSDDNATGTRSGGLGSTGK